MNWILIIIGVIVVFYLIGKNKQKKEIQINTETPKNWLGKNEIESIRDDGVVIYKSNRVTSAERKEIGFYGLKRFSEDNKYCVVYLPHFEDEDYNIGLIEVNTQKILYRVKLQRPHRCRVSKKGIVVCEDWLGYDEPKCKIIILELNGNILLEKCHKTGIGDTFEFIEDETKFRYNINSTNKIHIIDIAN